MHTRRKTVSVRVRRVLASRGLTDWHFRGGGHGAIAGRVVVSAQIVQCGCVPIVLYIYWELPQMMSIARFGGVPQSGTLVCMWSQVHRSVDAVGKIVYAIDAGGCFLSESAILDCKGPVQWRSANRAAQLLGAGGAVRAGRVPHSV